MTKVHITDWLTDNDLQFMVRLVPNEPTTDGEQDSVVLQILANRSGSGQPELLQARIPVSTTERHHAFPLMVKLSGGDSIRYHLETAVAMLTNIKATAPEAYLEALETGRRIDLPEAITNDDAFRKRRR